MTRMTSTYTQAEAETMARIALTTATGADWNDDTVSDALDVYLGALEREQGHRVDRNAIPQTIAATVIDTIISDTHDDH